MSVENIINLRNAIAADPEMRAKYEAIRGVSREDVAEKTAALSVEAGTPFSADDLLTNVISPEQELSPEQLESVSGGGLPNMDAGEFFSTVFSSMDLACLRKK